jgi:NAD-dependent dihydropyrimidine dehydrogenase PreA subunit
MNEKESIYASPNPPAPCRPVIFDQNACDGCNRCVNVCPMDVFIPNPEKKHPPIVLYPDECFYCGACIFYCHKKESGAIRMNHPLMARVRWKRKTTGEHFRV